MVGKPGHEYQVRVANRLGEDLLAVVSVDGVNVITGQTANPSQSGYVISPRGALEMQGWRRSLSQTAAFYFTALPDSYAARTGRPDDVGVIGVALFRKKPQPHRSALAPEAAASAAPRSRRSATTRGSAPATAGTSTRPPCMSPSSARPARPAEVITLYYDSQRNLVARGVIREPVQRRARRRGRSRDSLPDPREGKLMRNGGPG